VVFEVERLRLIYAWSDGGAKSRPYHWAAPGPEAGWSGFCCLCGTARNHAPQPALFLLSLAPGPSPTNSRLGMERASGQPGARGLRNLRPDSMQLGASQAFLQAGPARSPGLRPAFEGVTFGAAAFGCRLTAHDPHDLLAMLDTWLAQ